MFRVVWAIFISSVIFSGCKNASITFEGTSSSSTPYTLAVTPVYPVGPDWNDYVRTSNTNTQCNGTETSSTACIHSGEKRKVVTGESSCNGLSLTDSLGVFNWSCGVTGGVATFYSSLKSDKGLRDLVNDSGWIPNSVTLTGGTSYNYSPSVSSNWWTNPTTNINSNISPATTYSTPAQIYIVSSSISSDGINLNADKIALVTLAGVTINWANGFAPNYYSGNGETAGADSIGHIAAGSQKFLWIEANTISTTANKAATGIALIGGQFNRIHRSNVVANTYAGILTESTHYNYFTSNNAAQNSRGFYIANSNSNRFYQNKASNQTTYEGVYLFNSHGNTLVETIMNNNSSAGIQLSNSYNNYIVATTSVSNNSNAIYFGGSAFANQVHLETASNNYAWGVSIGGSADYSTFSQLAVSDSTGGIYGAVYSTSTNLKFTGNLLAQAVPTCNAGVTYGILNNCGVTGSSDHNLVSIPSLGPDFVGQIAVDDSANISDSNGTAAYSLSLDWFNFANNMRSWGKNYTFPGVSSTGICSFSTCRIYDYSMLTTGSVSYNRTGDGSTPNSLPTSSACPAEVDGNITLSDLGKCSSPQYSSMAACSAGGGTWATTTYLKSAYEAMNDESGNDNGLCEAGEKCIYAPNFGAYQGHGDLTKCNYNQAGGLAGITMYYYPANGK